MNARGPRRIVRLPQRQSERPTKQLRRRKKTKTAMKKLKAATTLKAAVTSLWALSTRLKAATAICRVRAGTFFLPHRRHRPGFPAQDVMRGGGSQGLQCFGILVFLLIQWQNGSLVGMIWGTRNIGLNHVALIEARILQHSQFSLSPWTSVASNSP